MCLKTVMDQCYTDISDAEEQVLFAHAPKVIQHIRTEGCVTYHFWTRLEFQSFPMDGALIAMALFHGGATRT